MCTGFEIAALAIAAAGTAGSIQSSKNQQKHQQALYDRQVAQTKVEQRLESEDREQRLRRKQAEINALYGASGVALSGSPTRLLEATAEEFAREEFGSQFRSDQSIAQNQIEASASASAAKAKQTGALIDFGAKTLARG